MKFLYYPKILNPLMLGALKDEISSDPLWFLLDPNAFSQDQNSHVPPLDQFLTGNKYHRISDDAELTELANLGLTGVFVSVGEVGDLVVSDDIYHRGGPLDGQVVESPDVSVFGAPRSLNRSVMTINNITESYGIMYHPFVPDAEVDASTTMGGSYKEVQFYGHHNLARSMEFSNIRKYVGIEEDTGLHLFETRIRAMSLQQLISDSSSEPVTSRRDFGIDDYNESVYERVIVEKYYLAGFMMGEDEHFIASTMLLDWDSGALSIKNAALGTIYYPREREFVIGIHLRPFDMEKYLDKYFEVWESNIEAGLLPSAVWSIKSHEARVARAKNALPALPTHIGRSHIIAKINNGKYETRAAGLGDSRSMTGGKWYALANTGSDVLHESGRITSNKNPDYTGSAEGKWMCEQAVTVSVGKFGGSKLTVFRNTKDYFPWLGLAALYWDGVTTPTDYDDRPINYVYEDAGVTGSLKSGVYGLIDHLVYEGTEPWEETTDWKHTGAEPSLPSLPMPDPDAPGSTNEEQAARQEPLDEAASLAADWLVQLNARPNSIATLREKARYHYAFPLLG